MNTNISPIKYGPVVCAVGKNYQIMIPVKKKGPLKVTVGGKDYFDVSNGIRIHEAAVQKFTVSQNALDAAGKYTVTSEKYHAPIKKCISASGKTENYTKDFTFKPVDKNRELNIYVVSDAHGLFKEPVKSASIFGKKPDLLIMNGDVSSSSSKLSDILLTYKIAFAITKGGFPCIITRGNHDLRGKCAEQLEKLMPNREGKPYYSTVLGNKWFLILDCGEDKLDCHREYAGSASFHQMRLDETKYLRNVIKNKNKEFSAENVNSKIIISHIPFNYRNNELCKGERPFNIEDKIYNEWCDSISEHIKPDLYIAGHMHIAAVHKPDSPYNDRKLSCPTVLCGVPDFGKTNKFIGAAISLNIGAAEISFNNNLGEIINSERIYF